MNRDKMLAFVNRNPLFHLGTCEGDQPRVRAIMTYRADERGVVFLTGAKKDVNRQLLQNPKAELCFYDSQQGLQLRVTGRFAPLDDDALKQEILAKYTFLQEIADQQGLGAFTIWCLPSGSAVWWDQKDPFGPKKPFAF